MTPAQTRTKYATLNKRKQAALPKHRAHVLNATVRDDQPDVWAVVCADCAYDWRKTNAYDHGNFRSRLAAMEYRDKHNTINRWDIGHHYAK